MNSQDNQPQRRQIHWIWWVILIGLLIWNVVLFLPKASPRVTLPYSNFLNQVNQGNVASVQISGSEITGKFIKPIHAPTATPASSQGTTGQSTTGQPATTQSATGSSSAGSSANSSQQTYAEFQTTFPDVQGDPNFISDLRNHNVVINVTPPPSPIVSALLSWGLPLLLLVLVMVWIGRRSNIAQSGFKNISNSKAREYSLDRPKVTFMDVAGVDEAKQDLQEVVDFLRRPYKYHQLGARIPHGVLLVGPPGTGKTLMARAVAGEAGVPFFSISASEFVEMFVGVGASRVRDLFEKAKAVAPAIVFIDELDAVGRRRGTGLGNVNDEREQTLNQLLVEMDGFDENHETIVLAATNRPDVLDPALLRPGRFDRQVTVGLPDRPGREKILRIHTKKLTLAADVRLELISRTTTGFSGADLANLCNEAALNAARENHQEIHQMDFEIAIDRVRLGAKRSLILNENDRKIIAYHESGHALVAWLMPEADPVHKVTIIPRGRALGVTEQVPGEDQYNYSKGYLLSRLAVMLGGRVAEQIALKDITTGAENDLVEATRLARRMITRWGMGDLGPMALSTDEQQPFLGYDISQGRDFSDETAAQIDRNVQTLLADRYELVRQILTDARDKLDSLVSELLEDETIDQDGLLEILGPRVSANGDHRLPPMDTVMDTSSAEASEEELD